MLSRSQFDAYVSRVSAAEAMARANVSEVLSEWLGAHPGAARAEAEAYARQAVADAVSVYGDVSGVAAEDMFTALAGDVDLATILHLDPDEQDYAGEVARLSSHIDDDPEGFAQLVSAYAGDQVAGRANATMALTCSAHGIRYARVPTSPTPCPFCSMLASRGYVYSEEPSRSGGINHDNCRCKVMPLLGDGIIEGYDTDALFEQYLAGVESGEINLQRVVESATTRPASRPERRFESVADMTAFLRLAATIEDLQARCAEVEEAFRQMGLSEKYRRDLRMAAMGRKKELDRLAA